MEVNLATESVKFMILGMGTVFTFLVVMIIFMNIQSKVLQAFFPDKPQEPTNSGSVSTANTQPAQGKKTNKVAAIIAGILHHNTYKA